MKRQKRDYYEVVPFLFIYTCQCYSSGVLSMNMAMLNPFMLYN